MKKLKIKNFLIFPGSETKLLKGLRIRMFWNHFSNLQVTAPLARKVFDDFEKKKNKHKMKN